MVKASTTTENSIKYTRICSHYFLRWVLALKLDGGTIIASRTFFSTLRTLFFFSRTPFGLLCMVNCYFCSVSLFFWTFRSVFSSFIRLSRNWLTEYVIVDGVTPLLAHSLSFTRSLILSTPTPLCHLYYLVWLCFTCKYPVMRASNQPLHTILCDDNLVWVGFLFHLLSFQLHTFHTQNGCVILVFVTNPM